LKRAPEVGERAIKDDKREVKEGEKGTERALNSSKKGLYWYDSPIISNAIIGDKKPENIRV
jgi:hypothetical protein